MKEHDYKLHRANAAFLDGRYAEAIVEYQKGTRQEDPFAAINLAYILREGIGTARNEKLAASLYQSALYLDTSGVAAFNLALLSMRGIGVPIDLNQALSYMEKSAEMRCIDAQLYLGLAYLLGCVYDPVHIRAIHHIPSYHVVYNQEAALLEGEAPDPVLEDARWEVLMPDPERSAKMYRDGVKGHDIDEFSEQVGNARFMLGQSMIEGVGGAPRPRSGFRQLEAAALLSDNRDAAQYLLENHELAAYYGVNVERIRGLLTETAEKAAGRGRVALPQPKRPKK